MAKNRYDRDVRERLAAMRNATARRERARRARLAMAKSANERATANLWSMVGQWRSDPDVDGAVSDFLVSGPSVETIDAVATLLETLYDTSTVKSLDDDDDAMRERSDGAWDSDGDEQ